MFTKLKDMKKIIILLILTELFVFSCGCTNKADYNVAEIRPGHHVYIESLFEEANNDVSHEHDDIIEIYSDVNYHTLYCRTCGFNFDKIEKHYPDKIIKNIETAAIGSKRYHVDIYICSCFYEYKLHYRLCTDIKCGSIE